MVKQIIIVRHKFPNGKGGTISPRLGKTIAQAAHAAQKWIVERVIKAMTDNNTYYACVRISNTEREWMLNGFKKVVLRCEDEKQILDLWEKAKSAGLQTHMIYDEAKTEFIQSEYTALAIGPDLDEKINPITIDLKLL